MHVRLIAQQDYEGWTAALYDMNGHGWIDEGGWKYNTPEEAQKDAQGKAEALLKEPLPDLDWRENG